MWKVPDAALLDHLHYESVKMLWKHFIESEIHLFVVRPLNNDVLKISNLSLTCQ